MKHHSAHVCEFSELFAWELLLWCFAVHKFLLGGECSFSFNAANIPKDKQIHLTTRHIPQPKPQIALAQDTINFFFSSKFCIHFFLSSETNISIGGSFQNSLLNFLKLHLLAKHL